MPKIRTFASATMPGHGFLLYAHKVPWPYLEALCARDAGTWGYLGALAIVEPKRGVKMLEAVSAPLQGLCLVVGPCFILAMSLTVFVVYNKYTRIPD